MWVGVLGSVEARCGVVAGRPIRLASTRQRALLAVLASRHGEPCSVDLLVDSIWEGDPAPERGQAAVQTLVSRLRTAIGDAGGDPDCLQRVAGRGYRLERTAVRTDAGEFESAFAEGLAGQRAGAPDLAAESLQQALALFRGEPYAEFAHRDWARAEVARLNERRGDALEVLIEVLVDTGSHREALALLPPAIEDHPYRERFRALHMTALHRAGRHRDALAAYQEFRRQLDDDLGLEPSSELRALESRILSHDPALTAPGGGRPLRGYRLRCRLESDGLGERWLATQPGLGRDAVVTILDPALPCGRAVAEDFEACAARLGRLDRAGMTPLVDAWHDTTGAYLVSRPARGEPLASRLLSPRSATDDARWHAQVTDAVTAARAAGVAHGHLSPSCIHVDGTEITVSGWGVPATEHAVAADERGLAELARLLELEVTAAGHAARRNPYRGVAAFEAIDAPWFCGRDDDIATLHRLVDTHPFVTVIGASGSGKSSLVRAGLVPRLPRGTVTVITPGPHPTASLSTALVGLVPDHGYRTVVIDQLEELFTHAGEDERRAFAALVTDRLARDPTLRFVATLRADHLAAPLADPELGTLVGTALLPLGPLTPAGLTRAVVDPAADVGIEIDPVVVSELVSAVSRRPDALPLLQFTLTELVDRTPGRRIAHGDLVGLGGLEGSIGRRADEVYEELSAPARARARFVLTRLATLHGGVGARQRVERHDLGGNEATDEVIERFVAARLIALDADPVSRHQLVALAHEAIVTEWRRLADWLADDEAALADLHDTRAAVGPWIASGRSDDLTLRGLPLARAAQVADARPDLLTEDEAALVAASRRRASATTRRQRRTSIALAVLAVLAVMAAGFALVQRRDARTSAAAERSLRLESDVTRLAFEARALAQSQPDLAMLLAVEAWRRAPGSQTESALLEAIEGQPQIRSIVALGPPDGPLISGVLAGGDRIAIRTGHTVSIRELDALGSPTVATFDIDPAAAWAMNADGTEIATASTDGSVRRWSTASTATVVATTTVAIDGGSRPTLTYLADDRIAVADRTGIAVIGLDGAVDTHIELDDPVRLIVAHPTAPELLVGGVVGVSLVDVEGGTASALVGFASPAAMTYSADGSRAWLVTGAVTTGSTLSEIDTGSTETLRDMSLSFRAPARVLTLSGSRLLVTDQRGAGVVVGPTWESLVRLGPTLSHPIARTDGTVIGASGRSLIVADVDSRSAVAAPSSPRVEGLATLDADGSTIVQRQGSDLVLVDSESGAVQTLPVPPVPGIPRVSPDGRVVAVTGQIVAEFFDLATGRRLGALQSDGLISFSPDGTMVAVSGIAGVVVHTLPDFEPVSVVAPITGDTVTDLVWSPDGRLLAVTGTTVASRLIDPLTAVEAEIAVALDAGEQIRWSSDGTRLVVLSAAGRSRLVDVATGDIVRTLPTVNGPVVMAGWVLEDSRFVVIRGVAPNDAVVEITDLATGTQIGPALPVAPISSVVNGLGRIGDTGIDVVATGQPAVELPLEPSRWAAIACRIAGRDLSLEEWDRHLATLGPWRSTCGPGS